MVTPRDKRSEAAETAAAPAETLSRYEERNLAAAMPLLRAHAEALGILGVALDDWTREQRMRFFAAVIRIANPMMAALDAEAQREFDDEIPF